MQVTCEGCGKSFDAKRASARTCSATCRKRVSRRPSGTVLAPVEPPKAAPPPRTAPAATLVDQTRRELEDADRLDTVIGQQALRLAEQMCSGFDTGSAMAAVSREFRAVMALALADAETKADPLDELAARRAKKASGA